MRAGASARKFCLILRQGMTPLGSNFFRACDYDDWNPSGLRGFICQLGKAPHHGIVPKIDSRIAGAAAAAARIEMMKMTQGLASTKRDAPEQ